jgi:hypothetical protein
MLEAELGSGTERLVGEGRGIVSIKQSSNDLFPALRKGSTVSCSSVMM